MTISDTLGAGNQPLESSHPYGASAFGSLSSHLRLWVTASLGVAADLLTKDLAFGHLEWANPKVLVPSVLRLELSLNPGALFGFGANAGTVFIAASILALPFVVYIFAHSHRRQLLLHVALGMILGGAMGNLYDRAFVKADIVRTGGGQVLAIGRVLPPSGERAGLPQGVRIRPFGAGTRTLTCPPGCEVRSQGVVRDFIKIETTIAGRELWRWVFNVADALLVVGVILLILNSLFERQARRSLHAAATADGGRAASAEKENKGPV
ncbi:MAG TPA: signal peptidase II [Phycisphaerae bacterium]|nr:signal peptidase II [Phycisphaerae bacterium]